jgi:hypothetical protein
MFGRASILLTIAARMLATPVAAQAPVPTTTFDGKYVGTATLLGGGRALNCDPTISEEMIIIDGEVMIQEILFNNRGRPLFRGNISATGEVSASHSFKALRGQTIDIVSGIINDTAFVGQRRTGYWCYHHIEMQKVSAVVPMPFDGRYRGVSREVTDSGSNQDRCHSGAASAPRALTITNGAVETPGKQWWEGTVSPQGAVVMRSPSFARVDAQIDSRGTIRGEYRGEVPYELLAQLGGGGTNCIVKFVWQKE